VRLNKFRTFNIHQTSAKRAHPRDLAEASRSDASANLMRAPAGEDMAARREFDAAIAGVKQLYS
jgi:hypothetical protein